jgi:glycosyltransferase involved in cell wall biosynthesis
MRIAVASDIELGSHRAHAINVVKTAGGFARLGHDTRVYLRQPSTPLTRSDAAATYNEPSLAFDLAPPPPPGRADYHTETRQRAFAHWLVQSILSRGADIVYARHFEAGLAAAACGLRTILETHAYIGDTNPALARALAATNRSDLNLTIVTISPALRNHYVERGADPARVAVVPDGVDVEMFAPPEDPGACPFPRSDLFRAHAVYAGHLYDYKGIPTILEAAALLPDIAFELVGGTPQDIDRTRARISDLDLRNVRLHGLRPYSQVPRYLWHADVLLLPPSAAEASAQWTSPVKLGEYLASGRPIVASRIAGLTTWVNEPAVRWFEPDSGSDLAHAITAALRESPAQAEARRLTAAALAQGFSYPERARAMLRAVATSRALAAGSAA